MAALPSEAFEYEAEDSWRSEQEMEQEYRGRFAPRGGSAYRAPARATPLYRSLQRSAPAYRAPSRPVALRPPAGGQRRPLPPVPPRRPHPRPYPYPYPVGGPWPVDVVRVGAPGSSGSEYTRWVQSSLNQVLNLQLPVDGVMSQQVRDAVRDFQRGRQLPADGIVGPDTERVLIEARRGGGAGAGGPQPADSPPPAEPAANGAAAKDAPANGQPSASEPPAQAEWAWEIGGTVPSRAAGGVAAGAAAGASLLAALAPLVAPSTQPTVRNALAIVKAISRFYGIPWRVAYTILQHEGGVRLFTHHDGVMQTTRSARDATISHIPRALKLALLSLPQTDTTSDANLTRAVHREFPRRLAVQIATGIQELKANLDRFNGYVALAYQAYNAGPGWAYFTVTQGKNKSRPAGVDATLWESWCRFGAALLHQLPNEVEIEMGVWQCDANIPTWSSHIPVRDRRSRLSLIAYKYLRSITERIHSQKPTTPCTWAVHGAQHRQAGTGPIVSRTTREGALDKLYDARKLGRYYAVASSELPAIAADNLPLKVLNGRLVKMPHASGNVTPIPV